MSKKEFREMDKKALQEELLRYKREYFNLRFQRVLGELSNTARIRYVRRNIARIFSYLRSAL